MTRVDFDRKNLSGAPLSAESLSRLLRYDTSTNKLYWRRREKEVEPNRDGTVRVRGHSLPVDYIKETLRIRHFPAAGEGRLWRWRDKVIRTIEFKGTRILVGIYSDEDTAHKAAISVLSDFLREYGDNSTARNIGIATITGARRDNTTGYRGVSYMAARRKYIGRVTVDIKTYSVGSYNTAEEAYAAVLNEEAKLKCR